MGILIVLVGLAIAVIAGLGGFATIPMSAPQQTVQGLYFVVAAIGLLIFAMGAAVHYLAGLAETTRELLDRAPVPAKDPVAAAIPTEY